MQTSLKYRKTILPGQMLLNWMSSSSQLLYNVSDQDISQLIQQYCTNLLVAGVIKQIPDKYAPIQETFRVSSNYVCMYVLYLSVCREVDMLLLN